MNNLTIAFEGHDGFGKLVEGIAKWMNVVPAGEDAREWLLDGTPNCDECRKRQKEEVDDLEAELRRVLADNGKLTLTLDIIKEAVR